MLVSRIQKDAYHDAAAMVREIETRAREEGEKKARNIIALAIQKCPPTHVAESTVSVINLPQRRHEGPHHRPRGTPHPRAGNRYRRGPDHRRHARSGDRQRL